ncbi:ATP phosphoribosyltransferase regulatory subunit [Neobacillus thermocopriae]|uniref:ATP phosphoribosyltransferase regulatory subunit n=1 Tax=Neobacillus thermocopriae TaxID=1215031 RepID=A0A6B3TM89_9BACI|nr:ATP phosphoribosyltransferase regulatory subunit [Neobacillus thermocopriae]MED3622843.1 ATP phosphoribosyltransferase regulatory subunit [Neobacillus thermocopriae]MED3714699.1 ATP phosphoribosyltransferase regulatory subunit [Neobacillus thermocopriae]NEX77429.1 ATP phosphoribosyltransferase regulatory subunit [Neobacillus thermocopriae]
MSRLFMFEKPLGMRDTLPELYEKKDRVRSNIAETMKLWGYQFIETPALEYFETVGEASAIDDAQLFKLLDKEGHTLVLRPEMTTPIARVAASKLLKEDIPIRLAYSANVFRAQEREGGRPAEFEQIGVEYINDSTISCDGEVIALLISSLKKAGLDEFQVSVGHVGFAQELFMQILGTNGRTTTLRKFLYEKNYVGYRESVQSFDLSMIDKQRLLKLLQLRGGEEVLSKALSIIENDKGKQAILELQELWRVIKDYGFEEYVKFDLSIVSHMSYYTGILFEVYAGNVGFPIGNGGRYSLIEKFGKKATATGFALRLDRLLEALGGKTLENEMHCIFFSQERRKEAFGLAQQFHSEGKKVVLQDITGVKDLDKFTKKFAGTTFLIGGRDSE